METARTRKLVSMQKETQGWPATISTFGKRVGRRGSELRTEFQMDTQKFNTADTVDRQLNGISLSSRAVHNFFVSEALQVEVCKLKSATENF